MLIVNDEQRLRAGIGSLSKRCQYCSKALAAYPLILSDDAGLAVYHPDAFSLMCGSAF